MGKKLKTVKRNFIVLCGMQYIERRWVIMRGKLGADLHGEF